MTPFEPPPHRTIADDVDDFAHGPSGGRTKKWIAGAVLPLLPIVYGIVSWYRGTTSLPGRGSSLELIGLEGSILSLAYIAIGAFVHFHYFWGLDDRLHRYSEGVKIASLCVFLPTVLYVIYFMVWK